MPKVYLSINSGNKGSLSRFANNTKICSVISMLEGRAYVNLKRSSVRFCTWVRATPSTRTGWAENGLRAALRRKTCRS